MLYNVYEGKVNIGECDLDYIRFGKGKKIMIMIQGLNTNRIKGMGFSLAYMYRMFVKEYTVYLFDRREIINEDVTVKDLTDDLIKAMDVLNIKNADIFGVSQGGMMAQTLSIHRPDLVNKMVLALTLSKNNDTVVEVINHWVDLINKNHIKEMVKDMAIKMYSKEYMKRYQLFLPLLTIIQKPKDYKRFIALARACLTCQTYNYLHLITCPVLVIGANEDMIVGKDASIEIAEKLNCELYMYENLGHGAYEEAKDFNKRVYDFFMK